MEESKTAIEQSHMKKAKAELVQATLGRYWSTKKEKADDFKVEIQKVEMRTIKMEEEKRNQTADVVEARPSTCGSEKVRSDQKCLSKETKGEKVVKQALITDFYKIKKRVRSMLVMSAMEVPNQGKKFGANRIPFYFRVMSPNNEW